MEIKTKFSVGDTIYIKNDSKQLENFIIEILISMNEVRYKLRDESGSGIYYEFELSKEKDLLKTL